MKTAQSTIRQHQTFGAESAPASSSRRLTQPMKTMPMHAPPKPRAVTLASRKPTFWETVKFRAQHSTLNEKVFATERRRLIGAGVGGVFAGAILHALITGKNDE